MQSGDAVDKCIKKTHMTLGGETDSSNPSRLIFSIKIPETEYKSLDTKQTLI